MIDQKIFLLSHPLSNLTPCYAGKKNVHVAAVKSIAKGDSCNMKEMSLSLHAGTHVDAPFHFLAKGKKVTDIPLPQWAFSKVLLIHVPGKAGQLLRSKDMPALTDCELLLIKTDFEKYRKNKIYWQNSPGLDPDLAGFLKKQCPSLRAVGVDFISISNLNKRQEGRRAHKNFLKRNILLIEDMKLCTLKNSLDHVLVSPIFVQGADGAPCTVWGFDDD